jgi:ATP adenylyltransferase|tara:strand:+ start:154 stop:1143 length:990 start_codon:yes stop_codon:yes gene_type:complete
MIDSFEELKAYLESKSGLRMAHIYKPAMLLKVLRQGGEATKEDIAKEFVLRDQSQIEFYRKKTVKQMPGDRLVKAGLLNYDKKTEAYSLSGVIARLSDKEQEEVESILEQRIAGYLEMRNPFGDSNQDAVPGSVRFRVLERAKNRCELCGVSSSDTQIDADHIVPRSKGGSNDISNLQALCRTCNAQKSNRADTDYRGIVDSYAFRESSCIFCEPDRDIVAENELAIAFRDGYPVTPLHTLVIPKRHVADYFDLYQPELNAINQLLQKLKSDIVNEDPTVTGFNVGINAGESAGQTVFHCHVHLIPRRAGDVEDPRGGVRGVIAAEQKY